VTFTERGQDDEDSLRGIENERMSSVELRGEGGSDGMLISRGKVSSARLERSDVGIAKYDVAFGNLASEAGELRASKP